MKLKRSTRTAAFGIALLAGVASSYAQGTFIQNGKNYIVYRDNIPDFDQRKMADAPSGAKGLPNAGNMYCVPTAVLNNLTYLANHGFPLLGAGPGTWSGSAPNFVNEYNHVTSMQLLTGILFHTDPQGGTGGSMNYLQAHLEATYPGQFAVSELYATTSFSPSVYDGALAMLNGSLVNLAYGWYAKDSYYNWSKFSYEPFYYRDGGHCVTMVGAQDWNGTVNVSMHDPANPGNDTDLITQSFFQPNVSTYQTFTATFSWEDTFNEDKDKFSRTMQVMDASGGFLDTVLKITPKFGYTYQNDDIIFITPNSPTDERGRPERPPFSVIKTGVGRKITDLAMDPFSELATFVAEGTDALFTVDPVSKKVDRALTVSNPRQVVYGDDGQLILLRDGRLDVYNRLLRRERTLNLPQPLDTIALNPATKRLVGYSQKTNQLFTYDQLLNREGAIKLPGGAAPPEKAKLFFDNAGNAYLLGRGSSRVTKVGFDRAGQAQTSYIPVPRIAADPDGGYVDESGRIFLTVRGAIVALNAEGRVDRLSKFHGQPAGESLHIIRPFANRNPNPVTERAYRNVLPPGTR